MQVKRIEPEFIQIPMGSLVKIFKINRNTYLIEADFKVSILQ